MREIAALPFGFRLDTSAVALIVIDMQRDFTEPGGFGASLGNDVFRLQAIIPPVRRIIDGFRAAKLPVIHTMECHRPDLSDLHPAKRERGNPAIRIGDRGPMGRVLIAGEPGTAIISEVDGEAFNQHLPAPIIAHPRQTRCPSSGTNSMYGSCCVFISRVLAHFDRLECVDTYVRLHSYFHRTEALGAPEQVDPN